MARKKKHPEHVNHERWLVSYADFITLLFAFFTTMYAISTVDQKKMGKLMFSMRTAFNLDFFTGQAKDVPHALVLEAANEKLRDVHLGNTLIVRLGRRILKTVFCMCPGCIMRGSWTTCVRGWLTSSGSEAALRSERRLSPGCSPASGI